MFKLYTSISMVMETPDPDKFDLFQKWLIDNGSKFPKLELQDYGNEVRGCHAKEEIHNGDTIVDIPLKCLITVEMGKKTEIGRSILASNIELDAPKHIFLMLFILVDRQKPDSFFKPYYDILPPSLRNMPIFWNEEEMNLLKGSFLVQQIKERSEAIDNDYYSIGAIIPTFQDLCSLEEFRWARMAVCSRNFGITVNGLRTAAMVPYADMLNHLRPRQSKWQFDEQTQSFTIIAVDSLAIGAQVYDSYGQKCNHRFLLNYGFSVESNVEADGFCPNEVPFLVGLRQDDLLFEEKMLLLRRDGGTGTSRRVRVAVGEPESTKVLLALLRLSEMAPEDYSKAYAKANGMSGSFGSIREAMVPLSIENETRAMRSLMAKCMSALDHYPTSYDEDVLRLSGEKPYAGSTPPPDAPPDHKDPVSIMYTNERHAVIQTRSEKEVLGHFLVMAEIAADLLASGCSAQDLETIIKTKIKGKVHDSIYQYCRGPLLRLVRDTGSENNSTNITIENANDKGTSAHSVANGNGNTATVTPPA